MPLDMLLSLLEMSSVHVFWKWIQVGHWFLSLCRKKEGHVIITWRIFPMHVLLLSALPAHPRWETWFMKYQATTDRVDIFTHCMERK